MQIVISSTNPVKRNAALNGFKNMFPDTEWHIQEVSVPSGVSDQPMSDAETLTGARQRVENAMKSVPHADYWVGIEGGVHETAGGMEAYAWVYIYGPAGKTGKARSGTFFLPPRIVELIHQRKELGEADDIVFNQVNSKQKGGTVGTLTHGVIDRTAYYTHAVILALIPFVHSQLY